MMPARHWIYALMAGYGVEDVAITVGLMLLGYVIVTVVFSIPD